MRRFLLTVIFSISIPPVFTLLHASTTIEQVMNIEIEKGLQLAEEPGLSLFSGSNTVLDQTVELEFFTDGSPQRILVGTFLIVCSFLIVFLGLLKDRRIS